jgi:hypothetical protein
MQTYTAIALLSLLGITLSASAAKASEPSVPQLDAASTQYMLSAQTQQRSERTPHRGSGRRDFRDSHTSTHPLQEF